MASESAEIPVKNEFTQPKTRISYNRDVLLEFKKQLAPLQKSQKRVKTPSFSKSQVTERTTRNPSSIVLGPQKRTWNTGCHVTQTSKSSISRPANACSDSSAALSVPSSNTNVHLLSHSPVLTSSNNKSTTSKLSDYKPFERSFPRNTFVETRKEFRSSNEPKPNSTSTNITTGVKIARPGGRLRNPGGSSFFSRSYGNPKELAGNQTNNKQYGGMHPYRHSCVEDEPEWFSEGPTNIHDTIELVGMDEDDDIDLRLSHESPSGSLEHVPMRSKHNGNHSCDSEECDGKAVKSEVEVNSKVKKVDSAMIADDPAIFTSSSDCGAVTSVTSNDLSSLLSLPLSTSCDEPDFDPGSMLLNGIGDSASNSKSLSGGSRFRHLFSSTVYGESSSNHVQKNHSEPNEPSPDIHAQLMKFMKANSSSASNELGSTYINAGFSSSKQNMSDSVVALGQKLRSLLLASEAIPSDKFSSQVAAKVDNRSSPRVLTVEELEADLGTSSNIPNLSSTPSLQDNDSFRSNSDPNRTNSNLHSFLQSGEGRMHNTLSGLGVPTTLLKSTHSSAMTRHQAGLPPRLQNLLKQSQTSSILSLGQSSVPGGMGSIQLLNDAAVVNDVQKQLGQSFGSCQQQAATVVQRANNQLQHANMMTILRGPIREITQVSNNAVSASARITQLQRLDFGASNSSTIPHTATSTLHNVQDSMHSLGHRPSPTDTSLPTGPDSNALSPNIPQSGMSGSRQEHNSGANGPTGLILQQNLQAAWQDLASGSRNPGVLDLIYQRLSQANQLTSDGATKQPNNLVGIAQNTTQTHHPFLTNSNAGASCSNDIKGQQLGSFSMTASSLLASLHQHNQQQQQKRPIVKNQQSFEGSQNLGGLAASSGSLTIPPGFVTSASVAAQREAERRILAQQQQRDQRAISLNSGHRLEDPSILSPNALAHFQHILALRPGQQSDGSFNPLQSSVKTSDLECLRMLGRASASRTMLHGPHSQPLSGLTSSSQSRAEIG